MNPIQYNELFWHKCTEVEFLLEKSGSYYEDEFHYEIAEATGKALHLLNTDVYDAENKVLTLKEKLKVLDTFTPHNIVSSQIQSDGVIYNVLRLYKLRLHALMCRSRVTTVEQARLKNAIFDEAYTTANLAFNFYKFVDETWGAILGTNIHIDHVETADLLYLCASCMYLYSEKYRDIIEPRKKHFDEAKGAFEAGKKRIEFASSIGRNIKISDPRFYSNLLDSYTGLGRSMDVSAIEMRAHLSSTSNSKNSSSGCYIATACYGSYEAPEVLVFRKFRDEQLANNFIGRTAIYLYYVISPKLARFLAHSPKTNAWIRVHILDRILNKLRE